MGPTGAGSVLWVDGPGKVTTTVLVGVGASAPAPVALLDVSGAVTSVIKGAGSVPGSIGVEGVGATGVKGTSIGGTGIGVLGVGPVFGVFATGSLGASGTKSFVQPHPLDASKEIRFVCLEGNEAGTYFRGTAQLVDGSAVIQVPEEFRLVTDTEGLTVQLTSVGAPAMLWVETEGLQQIVVRGDEDCTFHYQVNGVRRGYTDFEPIRSNVMFVPEKRGVAFGEYLAPEVRQMLVTNGTLKADFTPDEETAREMGWVLSDEPAAEKLSLKD